MMKANGMPAEDLIRANRIAFSEFGIPKNIVSNKGINSVSD